MSLEIVEPETVRPLLDRMTVAVAKTTELLAQKQTDLWPAFETLKRALQEALNYGTTVLNK